MQNISPRGKRQRTRSGGIYLPGMGSSHGHAYHQIENKTINIAPQINRAKFIKSNNLEVLYTNAASLSNKINELKLLICSLDKNQESLQ